MYLDYTGETITNTGLINRFRNKLQIESVSEKTFKTKLNLKHEYFTDV